MLVIHHQLFSFNALLLAIIWIVTVVSKIVYQKMIDQRKEKLFAQINHWKNC